VHPELEVWVVEMEGLAELDAGRLGIPLDDPPMVFVSGKREMG
jgi:hypothetical protein